MRYNTFYPQMALLSEELLTALTRGARPDEKAALSRVARPGGMRQIWRMMRQDGRLRHQKEHQQRELALPH